VIGGIGAGSASGESSRGFAARWQHHLKTDPFRHHRAAGVVAHQVNSHRHDQRRHDDRDHRRLNEQRERRGARVARALARQQPKARCLHAPATTGF
jgi:hypothetical protein